MSIEKAIMEGIVFRGNSEPTPEKKKQVKTKAKKATYIHGLHGSGAAKMKADFRQKKANRKKR
jgi:hypothetical protein